MAPEEGCVCELMGECLAEGLQCGLDGNVEKLYDDYNDDYYDDYDDFSETGIDVTDYTSMIFLLDMLTFPTGVAFLIMSLNFLVVLPGDEASRCKKIIMYSLLIVFIGAGYLFLGIALSDIAQYSSYLDANDNYTLLVSGFIMTGVGLIKIYGFSGHESKVEKRPYSVVIYFKCLKFKVLRILLAAFSGLVTILYYQLSNYTDKMSRAGAYIGAVFAAGIDSVLSVDDAVGSIYVLIWIIIGIFMFGEDSKLGYILSVLMMTVGTAIYTNVMKISDIVLGFGMSTFIRNLIVFAASIIRIVVKKDYDNFEENIVGGLIMSSPDFIIFPILTHIISDSSANYVVFGSIYISYIISEYGNDTMATILCSIPGVAMLLTEITRICLRRKYKESTTKCGPIGICNKDRTVLPFKWTCFVNGILNYVMIDFKICCCECGYVIKLIGCIGWIIAQIIVSVQFKEPKGITAISDDSAYSNENTYDTSGSVNLLFTILVIAAAVIWIVGIIMAIFALCHCKDNGAAKERVENSNTKCKRCLCYKGFIAIFSVLTAGSAALVGLMGEDNSDSKLGSTPEFDIVMLLMIFFALMTANSSFAQCCGSSYTKEIQKEVKKYEQYGNIDLDSWMNGNEDMDEPIQKENVENSESIWEADDNDTTDYTY